MRSGWQAGGPRDLLDGTGTQDGAAGFGAYAQSVTSDDDPATDDDEGVFEVYYRLTLVSPDVAEHRPGIEVCPHLQRISNPGGAANDRKTALWGVRVGAILLF